MEWDTLTDYGASFCPGWRKSAWESLRTPWPITEDEQRAWHAKLAGNPSMRYFELYPPSSGDPVAVFGLTDIDHVNRKAQISLIVDPKQAAKGYGRECFKALSHIAFDRLNLSVLYAEVYDTNTAIDFWRKMGPSHEVKMPFAVFRNNKYHGSTFFFYESK